MSDLAEMLASAKAQGYKEGRADALDHCDKCESEQWDAIYRAEEKARADERKKVFKTIRAELHPCKDCPQKCEEQGFFERPCVVDHTISYLDLWNLLEKIESEV